MIGIYLCDDEDAVRRRIQTALERKILGENYDMKVVCSTAGAPELLSAARCLGEIHARLLAERQAPEETFTLRTGGMVRHIPLGDILFFETASVPHHVILHTAHSRMEFLGGLHELERQLGERFIRTHRAFLVAADKIGAVDLKGGRLWAGGRECLLSRAGKAELREKMRGSR